MTAHLSRRGLLLGAGAAAAAVVTSRRGFASPASDLSVSIDLARETGSVRPELHGHFAEHLGTCIYGGLWVGKNSSIPNVDGYRKAAIDYLKGLIPVLRWPGGCFADDYHWRDGIGPAAKRPKRVNIHWGMYTEDDGFGTHEFIGLCRAIGAEPYLAGNLGSGSPEELRDWMEYCNYPKGSSLADERAANGSPEPFNVKYWGVGNENWGCGGSMTGDEYATVYRRFANYLKPFGGTNPFLIACGPNGNSHEWTEKFWGNMHGGRRPDGFAMHFYSNGRGHTATHFTVEDMQQQFASFPRIEQAITEQRALLDQLAPARGGRGPSQPVGLLLDEWGVWDRMDPEEEKRYGRLFQQITIRSAVAAALGLNVIHRQAGKLVMTNIAQIVNVLHALLLTDGNQCVRTTTYWVYEMTRPHLTQTSLAVEAQDVSLSASRKEKDLTLTLVNPTHDRTFNIACSLNGGSAAGATARILHHSDLNAANTFATPNLIQPQSHPVQAQGGTVKLELPPLSVATVLVKLS